MIKLMPRLLCSWERSPYPLSRRKKKRRILLKQERLQQQTSCILEDLCEGCEGSSIDGGGGGGTNEELRICTVCAVFLG